MSILQIPSGLAIGIGTLPDVEQIREQVRAHRQQVIDSVIEQNRSLVPQSIVNQRRRDRLTVQQINRLNTQGIARGIDPIDAADNRSPGIRFLDLLDLPRNTVANAIFGEATTGQQLGAIGTTAAVGAAFGSFVPGVGTLIGAGVGAGIGLAGILAGETFVGDELQRKITLSSERRGSFAQPAIFTSDILRTLGVEDPIIRAVAGFAGDVLLDPLTYLSGGGNIVTWTARNGARIRLAKPASKILDDFSEHIARFGVAPQGAQYEPFRHLLNNSVKIGDDIYDLSGSGVALRKNLAEAAEAIGGRPVSGTIRQQRRQISDLLRTSLVETGIHGGLDDPVAAASREFFRRYAAKSDRQFTFPFFGVLANRLRVPLDIPIGRLGRAGEFKKALGATEEAFSRSIVGRQNALKDTVLRIEGGLADAAAAERALMASTRIDTTNAPEISEARRAVLSKEFDLEAAQRAMMDFEQRGIARTLSGMDDFYASMANGDAATAMAGPSSLLRRFPLKFLPWGKDDLMDLAHREAAAERAFGAEGRQLIAQEGRINKELRAINRAGTGIGTDEAVLRRRDSLRSLATEIRQAQQTVLQASRGEITAKSITVAVPEIPDSLATIASTNARAGGIDVKFADPIDRLLWEASIPTKGIGDIERSRIRDATDYLQVALGFGRAKIRALGKELHKKVRLPKKEGPLVTGKPEVSRVVSLEASEAAIKRRKFKISLQRKGGVPRETEAGRLFPDLPPDVAAGLRRLDRMALAAERQSAPLDPLLLRKASDLEADLEQVRIMQRASSTASARLGNEFKAANDAINKRLFPTLYRNAIDAENRVRRALRIGESTRRARENMRRHGLVTENEIPQRVDEIVRQYDDDVQTLAARFPGISAEDVEMAVLIRIQQLGTGSRNLRGFQPEGVTGFSKLEDVHVPTFASRIGDGGDRLLSEASPIAEKYLDLMSDFWEIERGLGIVPDTNISRVYLQLGLTNDVEKLAREAAKFSDDFTDRAARIFPNERFTISRMTDRMFFDNPTTGETDFIWMGELARNADDLNLEQQSRLGAFETYLAEQRGLREDPNWLPDVHSTDPFTLNDDVMRMRFHRMVPIEAGADLFNTNLRQMIFSRSQQHLRAVQTQRFREQLTSLSKVLPTDAHLIYPRDPLQTGHLIVEGQRYRRLKDAVVRDSALRIPIDDDTMSMWYPVTLADSIEDYARKLGSHRDVNAILRGADTTLSLWKGATLLHPSWFIFNHLGNAINSFASAKTNPLMWPVHLARNFRTVWKIHFGGLRSLSNKKTIDVGGELMTERQMGELFLANGIANPGRAILDVINTGRLSGAEAVNHLPGGKALGKYMGWWWRANAAMDDMWRSITYSDLRLQTFDHESAVQAMRTAHFDFSDISHFEQQVGTRVAPFWRWTRNNMGLQLSLLSRKPAYAAAYPKLRNAIKEGFADENRIPEELRPRWMREQVAVQLGNDPNAKFLLLGLATPAQEVFEVGQAVFGAEGFVETLKYVLSAANPLLKVPFELAVGKELFTGRDIGDPDLGEISYLDYVAQQFRPYREVSRIRDQISREDFDPVRPLLRGLIGGRLQQFTREQLERRTTYETGVTARRLRHQIQRSLESGDDERAEELAVTLTGHYRRLYDIGATDLVPRRMRGNFMRQDFERQGLVRAPVQ